MADCKLLVCVLDGGTCSGDDETCRQKNALALKQPTAGSYRRTTTRRKLATREELIDIARDLHGQVFQRASDVMVAFGYSPRSPMMDTKLECPWHLVEYTEGQGYRINGFPRDVCPVCE
jgi:hypothetical protein